MKCVVTLEVRAVKHVEVDAASVEEAEAAAFKDANVGLCWHCARTLEIAGLGEVVSIKHEDA